MNLEIGTISITGSDSSEFHLEDDNCSDQILAQFEECEVDVVFSPKTGGEKTAKLEIPYNHPFEPIFFLPLSGSAIPAICECDFEPDGDVDGTDLATQAAGGTGVSLGDFAAEFGMPDCPTTN